MLALSECWLILKRYTYSCMDYIFWLKRTTTHNLFEILLQARAGITEVHFLPFNPVEKRTAITYIDGKGDWHRVSKGAPEQVIDFRK